MRSMPPRGRRTWSQRVKAARDGVLCVWDSLLPRLTADRPGRRAASGSLNAAAESATGANQPSSL